MTGISELYDLLIRGDFPLIFQLIVLNAVYLLWCAFSPPSRETDWESNLSVRLVRFLMIAANAVVIWNAVEGPVSF
jgi:hypothetical protein